MPVKKIALDLAAGAQRAAEARAAQRVAEEAREAARRQQRASELLEAAPLHEWFPDTTFEIVAYTGVGTSLQYVSNGQDIIVKSDDGVLFGLSWELSPDPDESPVRVHAVKLRQPSEPYMTEGPYYAGRTVCSALEVGLWLEAEEPE